MTGTRALRGTARRISEWDAKICEQGAKLDVQGAPGLTEGTSGLQASPQRWWPSRWASRLSSPLPRSFSPQILERLNKMCGVGEQVRKKQQRLLKNMDAHKVMLDLLQIPYEKVGG